MSNTKKPIKGTAIKDLDIILCEGESHTIEFKESAEKSLASEACAFANASGGRIFIGVNDSGVVVGTDTSNAARSKILDTINQIEPRLAVDIAVHGNIVVVTVPEGANKPYSCAKGFYLRSGPNSQKLERDSIIEFFQCEGHIRYDEIVRKDLPLEDNFNEKAYKRYIRAAKISNVLDSKSILINLDCAAYVNDRLCFTNAGALFFRINDEDVKFRHAGVVCALYKGTDKAYIIDAKELNGDIVSNIDGAIAFLKRHLNMSYKIESLRRENILELPEDALREAVVNAVCHRNYFEKGARVMVEVFDDRVEITSPGGVCKGITPENFGRISITRNSLVASMLYRIDYIEQMGTGILRIKKAAEDANVAMPQFDLQDFFRVTFVRIPAESSDRVAIENGFATESCDRVAIESGTATESSDRVAIESGFASKSSDRVAIESGITTESSDRVAIESGTATESSDRVAIENGDSFFAIITYLEQNGSGKNADFVKLLELSQQRVRQILQSMVQNSMIERHGDKRHAYYIVKNGSDRVTIENRRQFSAIIKYLEQNGSGKSADFVKLLGLSSERVRQILLDMVHGGLIEKHGEKRHAHYMIKKSSDRN